MVEWMATDGNDLQTLMWLSEAEKCPAVFSVVSTSEILGMEQLFMVKEWNSLMILVKSSSEFGILYFF
jgi:hypothetical protein